MARQSIGKYCLNPELNYDGAEVIAQIKEGMYIDDNETADKYDDDKEVWEHYNLLYSEINDIRATSWTPLAKVVYSAFGFGSQDPYFFSTDYFCKIGLDHDLTYPVKYWCRDNHVLIITEGASTTDINKEVIKFVTAEGFNDGDTEIEENVHDIINPTPISRFVFI